jgi:ribonuclease T1
MQGKPVVLPGRPFRVRTSRKLVLALALVGALMTPVGLLAKDAAPPLGAVALSGLPPEVQATDRLIRAGGPFAYSKDGAVFANRERLLPAEAKGYYREYTVRTPGASDRGARRIVCGGRVATAPDACFYTGDHYASFARIMQ